MVRRQRTLTITVRPSLYAHSYTPPPITFTLASHPPLRFFLEPLALYLVASAGTISRIEINLPRVQSQRNLRSGLLSSLASFTLTPTLSLSQAARHRIQRHWWGLTPWSNLRLTITKTKRAPGHSFMVHARPWLTDMSQGNDLVTLSSPSPLRRWSVMVSPSLRWRHNSTYARPPMPSSSS